MKLVSMEDLDQLEARILKSQTVTKDRWAVETPYRTLTYGDYEETLEVFQKFNGCGIFTRAYLITNTGLQDMTEYFIR